MPRYSLEVASLTDVGRVRTYNEDSLAADAGNGVAVLADGMGGHRAGEVASRMATELIAAGLKRKLADLQAGASPHPPLQSVGEVLAETNRTIFQAARSHPGYQGMGTTLALALFHEDRVVLGHVGDSRVYRLREGRLQLLTRDDSLLQDQVEAGLVAAADAGESRNRHLVTRALGIQETVPAHLREEQVRPGDVYVLCTDGLNDLVDDADIELIVSSLRANLPLAARHLVQAANDNGGLDNVSVILVKVEDAAPAVAHKGWADRLFGWMR
ncbi:MAG: PP2C family protein-serine/threonine phosphatase [Pseudomonadota bacterium]